MFYHPFIYALFSEKDKIVELVVNEGKCIKDKLENVQKLGGESERFGNEEIGHIKKISILSLFKSKSENTLNEIQKHHQKNTMKKALRNSYGENSSVENTLSLLESEIEVLGGAGITPTKQKHLKRRTNSNSIDLPYQLEKKKNLIELKIEKNSKGKIKLDYLLDKLNESGEKEESFEKDTIEPSGKFTKGSTEEKDTFKLNQAPSISANSRIKRIPNKNSEDLSHSNIEPNSEKIKERESKSAYATPEKNYKKFKRHVFGQFAREPSPDRLVEEIKERCPIIIEKEKDKAIPDIDTPFFFSYDSKDPQSYRHSQNMKAHNKPHQQRMVFPNTPQSIHSAHSHTSQGMHSLHPHGSKTPTGNKTPFLLHKKQPPSNSPHPPHSQSSTTRDAPADSHTPLHQPFLHKIHPLNQIHSPPHPPPNNTAAPHSNLHTNTNTTNQTYRPQSGVSPQPPPKNTKVNTNAYERRINYSFVAPVGPTCPPNHYYIDKLPFHLFPESPSQNHPKPLKFVQNSHYISAIPKIKKPSLPNSPNYQSEVKKLPHSEFSIDNRHDPNSVIVANINNIHQMSNNNNGESLMEMDNLPKLGQSKSQIPHAKCMTPHNQHTQNQNHQQHVKLQKRNMTPNKLLKSPHERQHHFPQSAQGIHSSQGQHSNPNAVSNPHSGRSPIIINTNYGQQHNEVNVNISILDSHLSKQVKKLSRDVESLIPNKNTSRNKWIQFNNSEGSHKQRRSIDQLSSLFFNHQFQSVHTHNAGHKERGRSPKISQTTYKKKRSNSLKNLRALGKEQLQIELRRPFNLNLNSPVEKKKSQKTPKFRSKSKQKQYGELQISKIGKTRLQSKGTERTSSQGSNPTNYFKKSIGTSSRQEHRTRPDSQTGKTHKIRTNIHSLPTEIRRQTPKATHIQNQKKPFPNNIGASAGGVKNNKKDVSIQQLLVNQSSILNPPPNSLIPHPHQHPLHPPFNISNVSNAPVKKIKNIHLSTPNPAPSFNSHLNTSVNVQPSSRPASGAASQANSSYVCVQKDGNSNLVPLSSSSAKNSSNFSSITNNNNSSVSNTNNSNVNANNIVASSRNGNDPVQNSDSNSIRVTTPISINKIRFKRYQDKNANNKNINFFNIQNIKEFRPPSTKRGHA